MTAKDLLLISRMRANGIIIPVRALMAARYAELPVPLACAILKQESGGGQNVYGHDPTVFIGAGKVTRWNYQAYMKMRNTPSYGSRCQGVGPCQLTYWGFQDKADAMGGCWRPLVNMKVGFKSLADSIRREGYRAAIVNYNGSGPAAEHYADTVIASARLFAASLGLPSPG